MIFDDELKKRIDWSKVSTAAAIVAGAFGVITAAAEAVKTGMEAYEAVRRNLSKSQDQDEEEPNRIVIP